MGCQKRCRNINQAARNNCLEDVIKFLMNGEDPNVPNLTGITCLHHACFHNNRPMVIILLEHNANIYARDIFGRMPIDVCRNQQVKLLLL